MATRIGIRALRENLTRTIRQVESGESVEVTRDGKTVALLSPPPRSRLDELIAAGVVTPAQRPFNVYDVRPLPVTGPMTASEALEEDRNSERF